MKQTAEIVEKGGYKKVSHILPGGTERYHSSLAALEVIQSEDDNVLFHDAVRPLVGQQIITRCIDALTTYNSVDVAIPATDTIIEVDSNNCIKSIPNRAFLRNGQTPQGFKCRTIKQAYKIALADPNFATTDDCGVVVRYLPQEATYVIDGSVTNLKVTYPKDLLTIEQILNS